MRTEPRSTGILFYEPVFLFAFLPAVFGLYGVAGRGVNARLAILLAASLVFYFWGEPAFVPVVIASALLDYGLARLIVRGRRWALGAGVAANVLLLVFYKYLDFIAGNLQLLLGWDWVPALPGIALPIGVSFIVFEKITYLVDIARGRSQPAASFVHYLTYVLFFPKLLAGPIVKYHDIDAQFRAPGQAGGAAVLDGFARFMLGLVKKVLLADVLGGGVDTVFTLRPADLGFANAWCGVALFTLQIYLDFSAYSDMAIGLARMFGFRLAENFDMPYIACSVTEFWRRWHISLTTWVKEYLYIPLGGNRGTPWRTSLNLWLCFLASGLWHGAAWPYVLWGAYNGAFLVMERRFLLRRLDRLPRAAANAITLLIVMLGWTIFRAHSAGQLGDFLLAMANPFQRGIPFGWEHDIAAAAVIGTVIALGPRLPGALWLLARIRSGQGLRFGVEAVGFVLFAVAVSKALADPFKPFLYFRF